MGQTGWRSHECRRWATDKSFANLAGERNFCKNTPRQGKIKDGAESSLTDVARER